MINAQDIKNGTCIRMDGKRISVSNSSTLNRVKVTPSCVQN